MLPLPWSHARPPEDGKLMLIEDAPGSHVKLCIEDCAVTRLRSGVVS
jgi:hypothetical protein